MTHTPATPPEPATARPDLRGQIAPIAAICVFGVAASMSYPLFALVLDRMEASGLAIGLNSAAAAAMMIVSAPALPMMLARIGLAPMMVGAGLILALLMVLIPAYQNLWYWAGLRAIYGIAANAIFFTSEYWIVACAPPGRRGRVVALYTVAISASFMVGPALLPLIGTEGTMPFLIAALIVTVGLVPVLWGLPAAPPASPEAPPGPRATLRVFATDPGVVWGVALFGAIEFGGLSLLTVWAVRSGLSEAEGLLLLSLFALGAILLQFPIGWAADRFDRRRLLALAALAGTVCPLAIALVAPDFWPIAFIAALWGGLGASLYSLALTELGARYSGARLAEGNAAVMLAYGLGALFGPVIFGQAMDAVPHDGLLYAAAALAGVYLALILLRIALAPR